MQTLRGHRLYSGPSREEGTARDLAAHVALRAVQDAGRGDEEARRWLACGGHGVLAGLGLDRAAVLAALSEQGLTL